MKRLALVALLCLGAAGANAQEAPSRSVVRLSYIPGNFALPVLVGIEHGLFAREGLFLSTIPITDEATIMRSLASGGTDFAIGSQAMLLSI
ncbi:MAG TPA: ABC transporter substrate-binding protein, partial [Alphaproteobacteria bacterium]